MVYETQTESSHHYGDVYWCCNWFLCRWIEQSLGNIATKVRGKTFSSLVLHQTICRLQCLGSSCNISHKCLHRPASHWSLWLEKCEACSAGDWGANQKLPAGLFLIVFNCVSAVSAVAQVSDGTDVWITAWHLSWKYENLQSFGAFHLFKYVLFISHTQ